jgi:hypothetical protein
MKKLAFVAAALLGVFSMPASAAVLPVNGGWQLDILDVAGEPTQQSPWTVTFTKLGKLWILDCCIGGDTFTVSGDLAGSTTFYVGGPLHPTLDPFAEWTSASFAKLEIGGIAPGTYTFSITGDGAGGLPAGVWVAATDDLAVPEPGTLGLVFLGLAGMMLRRRRIEQATVPA